MKKVACFISNKSYANVNCCRIYDGNPGIGGSEFVKLIISYLLTIRDNGIEVMVFTVSKGIFPEEIVQKQVSNLTEAVLIADANNVDYFVFDHNPQNMNLIRNVNPTHLKFITLCHNFASIHALDLLAEDNRVFKIITVGREQKDLYRDHPAFYKTEYIYNCINVGASKQYNVSAFPITKRKNIVTYIGAINRYKGFHRLAQVWPAIIAKIPDAQLYVIGAGNLYDKCVKLGKYGIADEEYEDYFMQYLTKDGKILDSVHFMGILGEDKNDILLRTKVGVPNPTGASETFCISACEMQLMGASIVSKVCVGYLDTVLTGRLVSSYSGLVDGIVNELKNPQDNYEFVVKEMNKRFSYESVIKDWEQLFLTGKIERTEVLTNANFRFKRYKEFLRKLKMQHPFMEIIPPIESFISFYYRHFYSRYIRVLGKRNFDYIDTF